MAINKDNTCKFVSVVDVFVCIGKDFFASVVRNAEIPDQMIYEYDEKSDDNKLNRNFFKKFCSVLSDDGTGNYKVKVKDDWNSLEIIINLEEDDA